MNPRPSINLWPLAWLVALLVFSGALSPAPLADELTTKTIRSGSVVHLGQVLLLEVILEGSALKLYPLANDLKPISLQELKIHVTATTPRMKKRELLLTQARDHYDGKLGLLAQSGFTLEVSVQYRGKEVTSVFEILASNH